MTDRDEAARVAVELEGLRGDLNTANFIAITTEAMLKFAAARVAEERERAADIAELRSATLPHDSDFTRGYAEGRKAAAVAIRANPEDTDG